MAEYIVEIPDGMLLRDAQKLLFTGRIVRCKDCKYQCGNTRCALHDLYPEYDWFCADGRKRDD